MVQLYNQFIRNLDLYIHSLYNSSSLLFTFNHHNYAQWLVVYHNNLPKFQNTHLRVYEDFRDGCFALKRTSKQFSRVPVDLMLEQTINPDAACQRTRISPLTNSISPRQRWEEEWQRSDSVTEELKSHRMNQNWQDLEKLINAVAETINPFSGLMTKIIFSILPPMKMPTKKLPHAY